MFVIRVNAAGNGFIIDFKIVDIWSKCEAT